MRYVKQTLYYMFKHLPRLILPVAPAAILLGLFYRQSRTLIFIRDYGQASSTMIADVFGMLFSSNILYYLLLLPAFFIVLSFSCSYLLTMVYKHFRTGKLSVRMPLSNVNHGLEAIMPNIALIFLMLLVYKALFGCVVSLLSEIFVGGGEPAIALVAVVAVLGVITYAFVIFFMMYPVISVALMLVYGYTFIDAIGESLRVGGKKDFLPLVLAYCLPFLINAVVSYVLMMLDAPVAVSVIVDIILQLFVIAYTVLFSVISVFSQQKLERIDLKKLY